MFTNLTPPQPLPITIVTDRYVVEGIARTRRQRITDLLNDADTQALVLLEAKFTDLASGQVLASGDVTQVPLENVLFAYARVETASAPEMRLARKATKATLLAGPYTIEGLIHLPMESDLKIAVEEFQGRFIAVTQVRYCAPLIAPEWQDVDLVVVNHGRSYVVVTAEEGEGFDQPIDPLAPAGGGW